MARVIGSEHVDEARSKGRQVLEILPGDIVTDMAHESAARLGIRLLDGPLERPAPVQKTRRSRTYTASGVHGSEQKRSWQGS